MKDTTQSRITLISGLTAVISFVTAIISMSDATAAKTEVAAANEEIDSLSVELEELKPKAIAEAKAAIKSQVAEIVDKAVQAELPSILLEAKNAIAAARQETLDVIDTQAKELERLAEAQLQLENALADLQQLQDDREVKRLRFDVELQRLKPDAQTAFDCLTRSGTWKPVVKENGFGESFYDGPQAHSLSVLKAVGALSDSLEGRARLAAVLYCKFTEPRPLWRKGEVEGVQNTSSGRITWNMKKVEKAYNEVGSTTRQLLDALGELQQFLFTYGDVAVERGLLAE